MKSAFLFCLGAMMISSLVQGQIPGSEHAINLKGAGLIHAEAMGPMLKVFATNGSPVLAPFLPREMRDRKHRDATNQLEQVEVFVGRDSFGPVRVMGIGQMPDPIASATNAARTNLVGIQLMFKNADQAAKAFAALGFPPPPAPEPLRRPVERE